MVIRTRAVLAAVVACLVAAPAFAAPTREESQRADALFAQAKRALGEGRVAEACTLFAESQRLDPGGGTLYNLALCHAREGKLTVARDELESALALARGAHRVDAEEAVQAALRDLDPRLVRLRVRVAEPSAVDVDVELDGRALGPGDLGTELVLDPGAHAVTARAAGRAPFSARFEAPEGDRREVVVRLLRPEPSPVGAATSTPSAAPTAPSPRPAPPRASGSAGPYVLGAIGLAGVAAGAVLGGVAASKWSDAKDRCPARECADRVGVDASRAALAWATGSTIALGVGLAGVGAAVGWKLLAPAAASKGARLSPLVAERGGGALVAVPW